MVRALPQWSAAAVSVGIVKGEVICDLDYEHDSQAEVDMNVVKLGDDLVERKHWRRRGFQSRTAWSNTRC